MLTSGNKIVLEDADGISAPMGRFIEYREKTGMQFIVPLRLVIRLYGIAEFECNRRGNNWEQEAKRICEEA